VLDLQSLIYKVIDVTLIIFWW